MHAVIILALILAVLLVIFTLQNQVGITIHFFLWQITDAPLVLVLLACILAGYILAGVYFYPRLWKLKKEYNKLIRFNKELKQLHEMEHPKQKEEEISHPEGMAFDDDENDQHSFFKD